MCRALTCCQFLVPAVLKEMDDSGSVVFDIHLLEAFDDTADPGYYDDEEWSPEVLADVFAKIELVHKTHLRPFFLLFPLI